MSIKSIAIENVNALPLIFWSLDYTQESDCLQLAAWYYEDHKSSFYITQLLLVTMRIEWLNRDTMRSIVILRDYFLKTWTF